MGMSKKIDWYKFIGRLLWLAFKFALSMSIIYFAWNEVMVHQGLKRITVFHCFLLNAMANVLFNFDLDKNDND